VCLAALGGQTAEGVLNGSRLAEAGSPLPWTVNSIGLVAALPTHDMEFRNLTHSLSAAKLGLLRHIKDRRGHQEASVTSVHYLANKILGPPRCRLTYIQGEKHEDSAWASAYHFSLVRLLWG
jgi:hypothetical protein